MGPVRGAARRVVRVRGGGTGPAGAPFLPLALPAVVALRPPAPLRGYAAPGSGADHRHPPARLSRRWARPPPAGWAADPRCATRRPGRVALRRTRARPRATGPRRTQ